MTWEGIESKWKQLEGSFRERFGELTHSDGGKVPAKQEHLSAALQEKYGHSKEEADGNLEEWRKSLREDDNIPTSTSGAPGY